MAQPMPKEEDFEDFGEILLHSENVAHPPSKAPADGSVSEIQPSTSVGTSFSVQAYAISVSPPAAKFVAPPTEANAVEGDASTGPDSDEEYSWRVPAQHPLLDELEEVSLDDDEYGSWRGNAPKPVTSEQATQEEVDDDDYGSWRVTPATAPADEEEDNVDEEEYGSWRTTPAAAAAKVVDVDAEEEVDEENYASWRVTPANKPAYEVYESSDDEPDEYYGSWRS